MGKYDAVALASVQPSAASTGGGKYDAVAQEVIGAPAPQTASERWDATRASLERRPDEGFFDFLERASETEAQLQQQQIDEFQAAPLPDLAPVREKALEKIKNAGRETLAAIPEAIPGFEVARGFKKLATGEDGAVKDIVGGAAGMAQFAVNPLGAAMAEGAARNDVQRLAAMGARWGQWTDVYQNVTGERWLSASELNELAKTDPDRARAVKRQQMTTWEAAADEFQDLRRAVAEIPIAAAKGAVNMGRRFAAGDGLIDSMAGALEGPATTALAMGGEMLESQAKSARAGFVRSDAPLSGGFDLLGGANTVGGGIGAVRALRAGEGMGDAARALLRGSTREDLVGRRLPAEAPITEGAVRAIEAQAAESPLLSAKAGVPREAVQAIDEVRRADAADRVRALDAVRDIVNAAPEDQRAAFFVAQQGTPDTPAKYTLLEAQADVRRVLEDPDELARPRYQQVREGIERIEQAVPDARARLANDPDFVAQFAADFLEPRARRRWDRWEQLREGARAAAEEARPEFTALHQRIVAAGDKEAGALDALQRVDDLVDARRSEKAASLNRGAARAMERAERAEDKVRTRERDVAERQAVIEEMKTLLRHGLKRGPDLDRIERKARAQFTKDIRRLRSEAHVAKTPAARRSLFLEMLDDAGGDDLLANFGRHADERTIIGRSMDDAAAQARASAALMDPVNEALGLRGTRRVTTPLQGWMRLTAHQDFQGFEGLKRAVEVMRDVPGLERLRPPVRIQEALDRAADLEDQMHFRVADDIERAIDDAFRQDAAENTAVGRLNLDARKNRDQIRADAEKRLPVLRGRLNVAREKHRGTQRERDRLRREQVRAEAKADAPVDTRAAGIGRRELKAAEIAGREVERAKVARRTAEREMGQQERRWLRKEEQRARIEKKRPPTKVSAESALARVNERMAEEVARITTHAEEAGLKAVPPLYLDGKPLNTPRAALEGLGLDTDLRTALSEGKLEFRKPKDAGAKEALVTRFANRALLPALVEVMEQSKEAAALGIIPPESLRANLANYVRAFYDHAKTARFHIQQAESVLEVARQRAIKALEEGVDVEKVRRDFNRAVKKSADELGMAKNTDAFARKHSILGPVNLGMLKKASAKYWSSPSAQFASGRWGAERLGETLGRQLAEMARVVNEQKLYHKLASVKGVVLDDIPNLKEIKPARAGKVGDSKRLPTVRHQGKLYVKVPDEKLSGIGSAKKHGPLSGKWVDLDTFNYLENAIRHQRTLHGRFLVAWKQNKVVNNWASHLNIVAGNTVNQYLDGGAAADLARAYDEIVRGSDMVKVWERAGGKKGTLIDVEIEGLGKPADRFAGFRELLDEVKFAAKDQGAAKAAMQNAKGILGEAVVAPYEWMTDNVFGFGGRMRRLFETHEAASRFAIFRRHVERFAKKEGISVDAALKRKDVIDGGLRRADELQFDYADIPRWAQHLRVFPIGMPFIAYPLKATALFTKAAVRAPRKTRALGAAAEYFYDASSEEEKRRRDTAPSWRAGYTVPVGGKDVNVRYLSPVDNAFLGTLWDIGSGSVTDEAQPLIATFGGPLKVALEVMVNRNTFTGRDIFDDTDTEIEAWKKATIHVYSGMAPGTWASAVDKVATAMRGQQEQARGRRYSPTDAMLALVGIRVENPDVKAELRSMDFRFQKRLREIDEDFRRALKAQPSKKEQHRKERDRAILRERERFNRERGPKLH